MFNMTQTSRAKSITLFLLFPREGEGGLKSMWPPSLSSRVGGLSEGLQFITCPVFEKGAPRASLLSLGRSSCLSSNLHLF